MIGEAEFYSLSDEAIKLLDERLVARSRSARQRMLIDNFDELNVIKTIGALYANLAKDNEEVYADLMDLVFALADGRGKAPDLEWLEKTVLGAYDPVTLYIYNNEVKRKEERTAEAINSSPDREMKNAAFDNALRYWHDMTAEYADQVNFKTVVEAYRSQDVKRVRWVTAKDERVCEVCNGRDGEIYPISNVPPRPHWNCRCTIEPI